MKQLKNMPAAPAGFTLLETVLVCALLMLCLTAVCVSLAAGVACGETRGAAQCWQAAAAWAQLEVMWQGGSAEVTCDGEELAVSRTPGSCAGDLGGSSPQVAVATNVSTWRKGDAVVVRFTGAQASPNGGGSLYFSWLRRAYRVAVRPESGLTVRSLTGELP